MKYLQINFTLYHLNRYQRNQIRLEFDNEERVQE